MKKSLITFSIISALAIGPVYGYDMSDTMAFMDRMDVGMEGAMDATDCRLQIESGVSQSGILINVNQDRLNEIMNSEVPANGGYQASANGRTISCAAPGKLADCDNASEIFAFEWRLLHDEKVESIAEKICADPENWTSAAINGAVGALVVSNGKRTPPSFEVAMSFSESN
ncbi:MAG: hypothetical protein LBG89_01995 [Rickettsiales bacterium]|jgi:hypothetical protein|nr:hypothetical protein [Rickettsiales bacterium]